MFKKTLFLLMLVMAFSGMADMTFTFNPNYLINLYTTGQSGDYAPAQANSRFVYDGSLSHVAATYTDHPSRGPGGNTSRWTGNADYYADWVAGLGAGEGIRSFNIWITTADYLGSSGNPYSRIDVQQQLFCGINSPFIWLAGTASGDWKARLVIAYSNATWGTSYGIQWYTTNSASYLRPGGVDLGEFSFTMTDVWTGSDPDNPEQVVAGEQYRMSFSSSGLVFDNQGWGTSSGLFAFTNRPGFHQWQGDMDVTAIPEPATGMLLWIGGIIGLLIRRAKAWYAIR